MGRMPMAESFLTGGGIIPYICCITPYIYCSAPIYVFGNDSSWRCPAFGISPLFCLCREAKYGEVFRVYGVIVKYYTAKVWRLFEPCKFFSEKKQKNGFHGGGSHNFVKCGIAKIGRCNMVISLA